MKNLNLLFNKLYYSKLGTPGFEDDVKRTNMMLYETVFDRRYDYKQSPLVQNDGQRIIMETRYPGLIAGISGPHGSGMADDDIKTGLSFDYTTGQPYIPGSSVKGVLRSAFEEKAEAVAEIMTALGIDPGAHTLKDIKDDIFENGDVFLDAVVFDGNEYGRLLGSESFTPHGGPVDTPVPISAIKVLPGVRFEFRFIWKKDGILTAENKKKLFAELLSLFGVGAKTNLGYGMSVCTDGEERNKKPLDSDPEIMLYRNAEQAANNTYSRSNTQGNRPQTQGNATRFGNVDTSRKIKCPHCGFWVYKYNQQGRRNSNCFKCRKPL